MRGFPVTRSSIWFPVNCENGSFTRGKFCVPAGVISNSVGVWNASVQLPRKVRAPIYFGSSGCQRTETFGLCPLYWELVAGWYGVRTVEVFWLYHSSRSAKSTSKL